MRRAVYAIIAIVVIAVIVAGTLIFVFMQPSSTGSNNLTGNNIDIYGSEYGYGSSASNIQSGPNSPTITLQHGQTVTVTFHNMGTMAHNWAITNDKTDGSTNLPFSGAQIGSSSNPVAAGSSKSVTFTVGNAGNYYYICQVDGHVSLGMWGNVVVQ